MQIKTSFPHIDPLEHLILTEGISSNFDVFWDHHIVDNNIIVPDNFRPLLQKAFYAGYNDALTSARVLLDCFESTIFERDMQNILYPEETKGA